MKTISIRKWAGQYVGVTKNYMSAPHATKENIIAAMQARFGAVRIIDNSHKQPLA